MKRVKILFALLAITLVTSTIGVYAYSTSYLTITNQAVPGNNGV